MASTPARFLALFFALHLGVLFASSAPDPEGQVRRVDAARVQSLLQGDVAALERLFADELVYIHANGRVDTKAGYLAMLKGGTLTYVSLTYDPPVQIRVVRDTAVVTGRASIEAKSKAGQLTKRILTTTTVYVRDGGEWRVVSYQGTPAT